MSIGTINDERTFTFVVLITPNMTFRHFVLSCLLLFPFFFKTARRWLNRRVVRKIPWLPNW